MSDTDARLSDRVADLFDREHCVLTGRATTGLKLVFDELVDGDVLFPSYICPIAVYPAFYSNLRPQFCDVSVSDYNVTPETVAEALTPEVDALLATHIFGHPVDVDGIREVCDDNDVTIVEDACNAVGAAYGDTVTGSFGEVSVVSFGRKKPIDAGGGGAILTDDATVAERLSRAAESLPTLDCEEFETLHEQYVDVYSAVQSLREVEPRADTLLTDFPTVFERLFVHGFSDRFREPLESEIDDFEVLVRRRREVAEIYRRELDYRAVTHPSTVGDPVPFRYGILLESERRRDRVLSTLRDRGVEVNSLHEPVHDLFGTDEDLSGAREVSRRILNLRDAPRLADEEHYEYARTVRRAIEACG